MYLLYYSSSKGNEVPSVFNQLSVEHHEDEKLTTTFQVAKNEQSASSFIDDEEILPPGYATVDTNIVRENIISGISTTYLI